MLFPLVLVSASARFFVPQVLPYARPTVQLSHIQPQAALRSSTPTMVVTPDLSGASVMLPATLIADDSGSTLLLASGAIIAALFLFAVVGTVVINFGIRKK
jgi:hypothetical protein